MKVSVSGCSVEEAMRILGGRWRLLVVYFLLDGPKRFGVLRRCIPGISQRMLTLDLRALEDAGLVSRTVFPTVPATVEYKLTEDGRHLVPVVEVMQAFGLWLKGRDAERVLREPCPEAGDIDAGLSGTSRKTAVANSPAAAK